jgi:hypothetical protein
LIFITGTTYNTHRLQSSFLSLYFHFHLHHLDCLFFIFFIFCFYLVLIRYSSWMWLSVISLPPTLVISIGGLALFRVVSSRLT